MKEKHANTVLMIILILSIAWIAYMLAGLFLPASPLSADTALNKITTGTTNEGDVEIGLTPSGFVNGQFKVSIATNTHSVDLSPFNLKQITTLEYEGKIIYPSSAPAMQGHHAQGTLVFETKTAPQSFTIKIKGIPSIDERVFAW